MVFTEPQEILTENNYPDPTPGQVNMENWLSVIHGAKGINYFPYFGPTPADNFSVMGEFKDITDSLIDVVCGPDATRTVTDNANVRGKRVDLMVKETDKDVYIFATRLTEPDFEWSETAEPATISVEFTVGTSGISSQKVFNERDKYKWEYEYHGSISQRLKQFSFTLNKFPVRPGSVVVTALNESNDRLINLQDDGKGNLVKMFDYMTETGTINYQTGQVNLNYGQDIPIGEKNIRICYAPLNHTVSELAFSGGKFTDVFEREGVRIYRIPKSGTEIEEPAKKSTLSLLNIYPNPVLDKLTISYYQPVDSQPKITIADIAGRIVQTIDCKTLSQGNQAINCNVSSLKTGIYFIQFKTGDYVFTQKIIKQ
jgi:hypothetical protein